MLSWPFAVDGAENGIYVGLIHRTLGDNVCGENVPAAELERAAVVDRQFDLARGLHQVIMAVVASPGGYNYWQFRICI